MVGSETVEFSYHYKREIDGLRIRRINRVFNPSFLPRINNPWDFGVVFPSEKTKGDPLESKLSPDNTYF